MSAYDDGGPAFPVSTESSVTGHQDGPRTWQFPGATLRDYFAAKAMPSSWKYWSEVEPARDGAAQFSTCDASNYALIAEVAYEMADAMLAERAK